MLSVLDHDKPEYFKSTKHENDVTFSGVNDVMKNYLITGSEKKNTG